MALWISCTDPPPAQGLRRFSPSVRFLSDFNELPSNFCTTPVQPAVDKLCGPGCRPLVTGLNADCTFIDRSRTGLSIHRRPRLFMSGSRISRRRGVAGRLRALEQGRPAGIGGPGLRRRMDIGLRRRCAGRTRRGRLCEGGSARQAEQAGEKDFHRASPWADTPWTTTRGNGCTGSGAGWLRAVAPQDGVSERLRRARRASMLSASISAENAIAAYR